METKALASRVAKRFGTRDPFSIASALGFVVICIPLVGIRGFYQYVKRCHIIYIDSNLSEQERRWVCAHELGHYFLHRGLNRIFMDKHTLVATNKYESEANRFAADLIYSDEFLQEYIEFSYTTVADCLDIPMEIAEYRMRSVITE